MSISLYSRFMLQVYYFVHRVETCRLLPAWINGWAEALCVDIRNEHEEWVEYLHLND
jgi:hypothetical protein